MNLISLDYFFKEMRIKDILQIKEPAEKSQYLNHINDVEQPIADAEDFRTKQLELISKYGELCGICFAHLDNFKDNSLSRIFSGKSEREAYDTISFIIDRYDTNQRNASNFVTHAKKGATLNGRGPQAQTDIPRREKEIFELYSKLVDILVGKATTEDGYRIMQTPILDELTFEELLESDLKSVEAYKRFSSKMGGIAKVESLMNEMSDKITKMHEFVKSMDKAVGDNAVYIFDKFHVKKMLLSYINYRFQKQNEVESLLTKEIAKQTSGVKLIGSYFYEELICSLPKKSASKQEVTRQYLFDEINMSTVSELLRYIYNEINKDEIYSDKLAAELILAIGAFPDMASKFKPLIAMLAKLETDKSGKGAIDDFEKRIKDFEKSGDEQDLDHLGYEHLSTEEKKLGVILADELTISRGNFSDISTEFIETFYKNVAEYMHIERPDNPIVERSARQVSERIHREVNKAIARNDAASLEKLLQLNETIFKFSKTKSHPDTALKNKLEEAGVDKFRALDTVYREPSLKVFKSVEKECIDNLEKIGTYYVKKGRVTEGKKCFDIGKLDLYETALSKPEWSELAKELLRCNMFDDAILAQKAAGEYETAGILEKNLEGYRKLSPKPEKLHFNLDNKTKKDDEEYECPECGSKVKSDSTTCSMCGAEFE